ncbi:UNVERIFIED_CONTAM: hypothetical protein K2H54_068420 [Gekko kuhli]
MTQRPGNGRCDVEADTGVVEAAVIEKDAAAVKIMDAEQLGSSSTDVLQVRLRLSLCMKLRDTKKLLSSLHKLHSN